MNVKNKTFVITGGSSGLGFALAKHYAASGANIALIARDINKLEKAKDDIKKTSNVVVECFSLDVSNEIESKIAVEKIIKQFSSIDVLINSAGILKEGYFENTSLEVFKEINNTNFIALVNMCHQCLPHLKQSNGRIVNIASMASYFGTFGYTAYCASKFAVLGFSEALRYELKPQGVKVQVVCPPEFKGPMVDGISEGRTPENIKLVQTAGSLKVETVLKQAVKGIDSGRFEILVGGSAKIAQRFNRWFPNIVRKILDINIKKIYVGPSSSDHI